MRSELWFCLACFFTGCLPEHAPPGKWDGTYIGYFHRNRQDTTPVTIILEGRFFVAAPRSQSGSEQFTGVFGHESSSLIFFSPDTTSNPLIQGSFQYNYHHDGTLRMWQEANDGMTELFLRQQ